MYSQSLANPVEDIEYFTENEVKPEERHDYYIGDTYTMVIDGIEHNDSRYTIEDFSKKYGQLWVLGKMDKESDLALSESMSKRLDNCIAPPEEANIDQLLHPHQALVKSGGAILVRDTAGGPIWQYML